MFVSRTMHPPIKECFSRNEQAVFNKRIVLFLSHFYTVKSYTLEHILKILSRMGEIPVLLKTGKFKKDVSSHLKMWLYISNV